MTLRINILGPVEIRCGEVNIEIRGAQQRTLLATLLVSWGKLVLTESIISELWGEAPPDNVENALHAHVSRLRRKFSTACPESAPDIKSWPSGYCLDLGKKCELDATIMTNTTSMVRNSKGMDPEEAVACLTSALALWRGPVFGGPLGGQICQAAAMRYEQTRVSALALLYDLKLKSGRHSEITDELFEIIRSESLNERFCRQLMIALYRDGRQAEALGVYRYVWDRLNNELGVEVSPGLRECEHAILIQDPVLLR